MLFNDTVSYAVPLATHERFQYLNRRNITSVVDAAS